MKILTRGQLIDMDPMDSEANAASELDRMYPIPGIGFGSGLGEIGSQMGYGAALAALKQRLEKEQSVRQSETALGVANVNARSSFQSALLNAMANNASRREGHDIEREKISSNERLKQMGLKETQYKEGQHNKRATLAADTSKSIAGEKARALRQYHEIMRPPTDTEMGVIRANAKKEKAELNSEYIQQQLRTIRGAPSSGGGNANLVLPSSMNERYEEPNSEPTFYGGLLAGDMTNDITPEEALALVVGDAPGKPMGVRGLPDYSVSPQDRAASAAYYGAGGEYNGDPNQVYRGSSPMSRFQGPEYRSQGPSDVFSKEEQEDIYDPGLQERLARIRAEFSDKNRRQPIGYDRTPGAPMLAPGNARQADTFTPVYSEIPQDMPTMGPGAVDRYNDPNAVRPDQTEATRESYLHPGSEIGQRIIQRAKDFYNTTGINDEPWVGQSPMSSRIEMIKEAMSALHPYTPGGIVSGLASRAEASPSAGGAQGSWMQPPSPEMQADLQERKPLFDDMRLGELERRATQQQAMLQDRLGGGAPSAGGSDYTDEVGRRKNRLLQMVIDEISRRRGNPEPSQYW